MKAMLTWELPLCVSSRLESKIDKSEVGRALAPFSLDH